MPPRVCLFLLSLFLLPQTAFARQWLVDTDWLAHNMNSSNIAIVDMSDSMQYTRFHIPAARHLPYNAITRPNKKRISLSIGNRQIMQVLGQLGIKPEMHIIIYDDIGGLNASRLFWELERIGHQQVSLLDGGLVKWILEGKQVVARHAQYPKTIYRPTDSSGYNNLATLDDLTATKNSTPVLLDVRSKEEYTGHPRQKGTGHIPGAHWWHWEDNVSFENAFQIQSADTLTQRAKSLGLGDKQQPVIVYCRSGHRAAHSYFTLRSRGYRNVKLYDGSMAEYSLARPGRMKQGEKP